MAISERSLEESLLERVQGVDFPLPDTKKVTISGISSSSTTGNRCSIKIGFPAGVPVSLDGVDYKPHELILKVRDMSGKHGIGRIEHMEDRIVGLKTRETYEVPAAETILNAHLDLEKMVLTRHQKMLKMEIIRL